MNFPSTCGPIASTSSPWSARNDERVLDAVDARRLDADRVEPGGRELRAVLALVERAGDAADPQEDVLPDLAPGCRPASRRRTPRTGRPASARETPPASTRSLSADRLMTQFEMMTSTESSGSGMLLDLALQELDVRRRRTLLVLARQLQHLVGHVEPVGLAAGPTRGGPTAGRRSRRRSRGRARLRPASARPAPSGCRSRATPARPLRAARPSASGRTGSR